MKLFFAPNTIAAASAIALNEAGLAFEPIAIDFSKAEQTKPEYQAINPKGRVPALVTDQGILTETGAILDYIAAIAPSAGLVPSDPWAAAKVRAMVHYLASTMHVNHAHRFRGHRWADNEASWQDMTAKVPETMAASCAFVEDQITGQNTGQNTGPLLFGGQVTIADCHLYTISTWLAGDGVTVTDFPKLMQFMDAMRQRASVQAVYDAGILT